MSTAQTPTTKIRSSRLAVCPGLTPLADQNTQREATGGRGLASAGGVDV